MEFLPFEILRICLGWCRSTCSCLSLGAGGWWCPELASDPSLSESLVSNTNFLCQQHVIKKMNWTFLFLFSYFFFFLGTLIPCGSCYQQSIFIAVNCGDLWSAIWMWAALIQLTWTNIYLHQSTGSRSCRLLFIAHQCRQAAGCPPLFTCSYLRLTHE